MDINYLIIGISGNQLSDVTMDAELIISVISDLEPCPRGNQDDSKDDSESRNLMCRITIELSTYTTLRDVQVCVDVWKPFVAEKDLHVITNLCKQVT